MANSLPTNCKVENCDRAAFCRRWCRAHYLRWYKNGDVQADIAIRNTSPFGRVFSEETRAKISKNRKGKALGHSAWNKGLPYKRGAEHYNWKGGISSERHAAMQKIEYRQWRQAVFSRDNYTCQICGQYGGSLNADHIEKWADNEQLRYEVTNGRTLCVPCHFYVTFKRKMPAGNKWLLGRKAG